MLEHPRRESPLIGRISRGERVCRRAWAAVTLAESPFSTQLNLRGDAQDPSFRSAAEAAIECALPTKPNTLLAGRLRRVYWLGPNEWLIVGPADDDARLGSALEKALAGRRAALTSVGHGQTALRVVGADSRDLLARGCPLDLHERSFGVGRCAQTRFAKAPVLIALAEPAPAEPAPVFELIVRRSFAEYLWDALADAAAALA
jgi:sarcosine oxidase, subunit gamma